MLFAKTITQAMYIISMPDAKLQEHSARELIFSFDSLQRLRPWRQVLEVTPSFTVLVTWISEGNDCWCIRVSRPKWYFSQESRQVKNYAFHSHFHYTSHEGGIQDLLFQFRHSFIKSVNKILFWGLNFGKADWWFRHQTSVTIFVDLLYDCGQWINFPRKTWSWEKFGL